MIDDDKAQSWCSEKLPCARYEALSAENERLRKALDRLTEASSKTLNEMVLRGNALEALEAENKRLLELVNEAQDDRD